MFLHVSVIVFIRVEECKGYASRVVCASEGAPASWGDLPLGMGSAAGGWGGVCIKVDLPLGFCDQGHRVCIQGVCIQGIGGLHPGVVGQSPPPPSTN